MSTWHVTVEHGDDLDEADFAALQMIRRTLLGCLGHGFITELNTYSGGALTEWSWKGGTADGGGIMAGVLDTLRFVAPAWPVSSGESDR